MQSLEIPTTSEALTKEWLTAALRESQTIDKAKVDTVKVEELSNVKGFAGELRRLRLTYDIYEETAPLTIIVKQPTSNPRVRAQNQEWGFYVREVHFYQEVAPQLDMNAPTCFFSALDGNTGDFILLLADLAPARNGNLRAGCSLEEAELALNDVAKLHADWWESPQLAGMDWLSRAKPDGIALFQEMYQRAWGPFVDRMKDQLPPEILEIGERYGNSYARIAASLSQPPLTLTHGDYHLDNLFFNTSSDGVLSATIIDWQCAAHGRGVFDVAYFLGMSLPPEMRRSHERELLRSYHAILEERGVQGYSFDRCWDEYRLSFFTLLARLVVVNGGGLQISEEQLEYYSMIMPRQIAPMVDLDIGNLLPQ